MSNQSKISSKLFEFHNDSDISSEHFENQLFELGFENGKEAISILDLVDKYGPEHRTYQADSPFDLIRQLYEILIPFDPKSILDLGCGNGRILFYGAHLLPNAQFHGIEMVSERVQYCRQLSQRKGLNINFLKGDATTLDLPKVDCIILINSLFPCLMPKLVKHLKKHAEAHPFMILSASTCNTIISEQEWLQEIQMLSRAKNVYDLRLFRSII